MMNLISDRSMKMLMLAVFLVASFSFVASASAYTGARVNYNYNVSNAESMAFDCLDSDCSSVTGFSGSYPFGSTTTSGEITIDYPANLQNQGYAVYHVSPGYVPLEFHADWHCDSGSSCGPLENETTSKDFYKIDQCSSTINSFSVTNDVYENEPVTVGVDASLDSDVSSAFDEADTGVKHVPSAYKDQYYSAWTNVTLTVEDENGKQVYSDEKAKNIYMSAQESVNFTWTPGDSGNHTIKVQTDVTDAQCASSTPLSSSKETIVQEERPQEEYYTIVNDLSIQDSSPIVNEEQKFSFTKISNFADINYTKHPVATNATYEIVDSSGNTVKNTTPTLPANSNAQDAESFSFNWTPSSSGKYNIKVSGVSNKSFGNYPTSSDSMSLSIDVASTPTFAVEFTVTDSSGSAVDSATVDFSNSTMTRTATTDSSGAATISNLATGGYDYQISKSGYVTKNGTVSITSSSPSTIQKSVTLSTSNTAPTISGLPDVSLAEGESTSIDLDNYVSDDESLDSDLSWSYSGNSNVAVSIDSNRIATFSASNFIGSENITFTVEDPQGATDSSTLTATVTANNTAPTVFGLPDQTLDEDTSNFDAFYLQDYISDAETSYSNLAVSITSVSQTGCGVSIGSDDYVDVDPQNDFSGSCDVKITAEDPEGATDSDTFTVTVNPVNDAPQITSSPVTSVDAYSQYYYQLSVNDPDNSSFIYSIDQGPNTSNFTINNNGEVVWDYPTASDVGNHSVTLRVSDGIDSGTQSYNLTVNNATATQPPVAVIDTNVTEGVRPLAVAFNGSSSYDPDGSIDSYTWDFGDGGTTTGKTAEYSYNVSGVYTATLTVEDNDGSTSTSSVQINVTEPDTEAPQFNPLPENQVIVEGMTFKYNISATDNRGSVLWSINNTQKWSGTHNFSIDSNGVVRNETALQKGNYTLQVNASDPAGNVNSSSFKVRVIEGNLFIDSYINGTYYDGYYSAIKGSNTSVENSILNISRTTESNISYSRLLNSTLNYSTAIQCDIYDSIVTDTYCENSLIDNSTVKNSQVVDSTVLDSNLQNVGVYNTYIDPTNFSNSTFINSDSIDSKGTNDTVIDSYLYNSAVNYSTIENCDVNSSTVLNSYCLNSNITNSWIEDSDVINSSVSNSTIDNSTVENSNVENSTINESNVTDSSITDSNIDNSTIENSTVDDSNITDSEVNDSTINNSNIDNSDIDNSTVTDSNVINSTVSDSNVTDSTVDNSTVDNSTIDNSTVSNSDLNNSTSDNCTIDNSTVSDSDCQDSNINNSNVDNSTITDSNITDSNITNSNITNSTIDNSTIENSTVSDGNITNDTIVDGCLTYSGDQYCADDNTTDDNLTVIYNNTQPVASFTASSTSVNSGDSIFFDGNASSDPDGNITSYSWEFGDGSNATGVNTTHSYSSIGTYTVSLKVKDDIGATDTETVSISVTSSGGGGGSGDDSTESSSSGGGGGGGFLLPGGDDINVTARDVDIDVVIGEEEEEVVEVNSTGETEVSVSTSGEVEKFISFEKDTYTVDGASVIPFTVSLPEETDIGRYTGKITLEWDDRSTEVPVNLNAVARDDSPIVLDIVMDENFFEAQPLDYTLQIGRKDVTEHMEGGEVKLDTLVYEKDGEVVSRSSEAVTLEEDFQTFTDSRQLDSLEPGEYTIKTTAEYKGTVTQDFHKFKVKQSGITGGFFNSPALPITVAILVIIATIAIAIYT